MIPGFYALADPGERYPFLYQACDQLVDVLTGEVKLRLYSIEEAREYLVSPDDFDARFVWQGGWFKAEELNARRQAWRAHVAQPAPEPELPF